MGIMENTYSIIITWLIVSVGGRLQDLWLEKFEATV